MATETGFTAAPILIVDDEQGLRQTFEMFLGRAGYRDVTGVATVAEAAAMLDQRSFDCVISDIVLPDGSGMDILENLRASDPLCPVVMITGYPSIETAARAVRHGAFDYLPKPVKKKSLLDIVQRALRRRQEERQERLRQQEYRHQVEAQQQLWDALPDLVVTVDQWNRIQSVNAAAGRWLRHHFPEVLERSELGLLPAEILQGLERILQQVREEGHATGQGVINWDAAGGERQLHMMATTVSDNGEVLVTLRDTGGFATADGERFGPFVGRSKAMLQLYDLLAQVAATETTVLITGESGVGKELAATTLHQCSPRKNGPLIKVDCTAIPDSLMESELFGHRRGAFTGAGRNRDGRIFQANGGTLFLDEIGDISPRMQSRLLCFLQEQKFYPVGSDRQVTVDVRIISATNADLQSRIAAGRFREDLYFRLRVMDIRVPALRERREDIPLLANYFRQLCGRRMGKAIDGFSQQAMAALSSYHWPGNVRELAHTVERACALAPGSVITTSDLPAVVRGEAERRADDGGGAPQAGSVWHRCRRPVDPRQRLQLALRHCGGNKARAARLLGVDRSTLYRQMARYQLNGGDQ